MPTLMTLTTALGGENHLSTFQDHQHFQLSMLSLRLSYCSLKMWSCTAPHTSTPSLIAPSALVKEADGLETSRLVISKPIQWLFSASRYLSNPHSRPN
jgi:hypothetical protein